ncbi:MAG: hypothetical protein GY807_15510 [Gammaproteobacteria bacterium]|nr:hypothetical protein [Gammaproteobacteria bacterium]
MSRQDELQKLISEHNRRLQILEERLARQGIETPPSVITEIEDIKTELAELQTELEVLPEIVRQNPYRGLSAFREEDADVFFGRETFTAELVESVQQKPLVAVLGPSGSGKSSIVFAGLIPALRHGESQWLIANFRPGSDPFLGLASALVPLLEPELSKIKQIGEARDLATRLSKKRSPLSDYVYNIHQIYPGHRLLLIADQFEELYTLTQESEIRDKFLDLLLATIDTNASVTFTDLHLIFTLRADFLGQALLYIPFGDALQDKNKLLRPMNPDELRMAIEKPAELRGMTFEAGLVERVLEDVRNEPGNLPLLEFALTQLWEQQSQGELTHEAYEAIGRVDGALSRHADQVFEGLDEVERLRARRVFVQLVRPGEGTVDTRRLARRNELSEADWILVQQLASTRLVVTNLDPDEQETTEVVHEALIQSWGRLREWMNEDRRFRIWQERLRAALSQWQVSRQDEGALLRGTPLAKAEGWLAERKADLSAIEQEFIQNSIELREKEERILEAQRQRELEQQRALAEEQRQRAEEQQAAAANLRQRAFIATGVGIIAAIAALVAAFFWLDANEQREAAKAEARNALNAQATAEVERTEAERQATIALARQLVAQADIAFDEFNYELALLLAIESGKAGREAKTDTFETYVALRQILVRPGRSRLILTHDAEVTQAIWNQDESLILTSSKDDTARVWDARTGEERLRLPHNADVNQATWNQDESLILTTSGSFDGSGATGVWDARTGEEVLRLSHDANVNQTIWSQDESLILTTSNDKTARVWDAQTGQERLILTHDANVNQATWNQDESLILTSSDDKTAQVWDAQTGQEVLRLTHADSVWQAIWNQDESLVLTSSRDKTVRVWDAQTGQERLRLPYDTGVSQAAWNQDESLILSWSWDGTVRVWDAQTGQERLRLAHDTGVTQAAWNQDESLILTSSNDKTARVWDAQTGHERLILTHDAEVNQATWNQDESLILSSSWDKTARVWDAQTGQERLRLVHDANVTQGIWSQDKSLILTSSGGFFEPGTVRVWDAQTGQERLRLTHDTGVTQAIWNQDESLILTRNKDNTVRVWDAQTGQERLILTHDAEVTQAIWNQDESLILTSSDDKTARVWDAQTGQERLRLTPVWQATWNQDESLILSRNDDNTARVWDAQTGQERLRLTHDDVIWQATWNQDESLVLTSSGGFSASRTVRVWDAQTGQERLRLTHDDFVWQAIWNQDESLILSWSWDDTVRVWDAQTGQERLRLTHDDFVLQATWNQDESLILSWGADTVRVWDAQKGTEQFSIPGNFAIWNNEETLLLVVDGHEVQLYYTQMEDLLAAACKHAPRNMTRAEWQRFMGEQEYRTTCP